MKKLTIMIFVLAFALLNNVDAQDNKTVVITVSGDGPTKQEALQTALRNAIEQAFGTFISSNTQILNDELFSDEIVSVSNGNIHSYNVISEVQTPDGHWNNTVKAIVSVDKLTSFCESRGVDVEFKGSLFALNIKQQMLNEKNELEVLLNMKGVLKKMMQNLYDYKININQPYKDGELWKIEGQIIGEMNKNIEFISDYMYVTIRGLSCNEIEVENYFSLNKKVLYVAFEPFDTKEKKPELFALRNEKSLKELMGVFSDLRESFFNFQMSNGVISEFGFNIFESLCRFSNLSRKDIWKYKERSDGDIFVFEINSYNLNPLFMVKHGKCDVDYMLLSRLDFQFGESPEQRNGGDFYCKINDFKFIKKWKHIYDVKNDNKYIAFSFANLNNKPSVIIKFEQFYSIESIEQIVGYSISSL